MLVRFTYLAASHCFAVPCLLRMIDCEKDVEILALCHQLAVLRRQLGDQRPRLRPEDRALLAALLVPLVCETLPRPRLLERHCETLFEYVRAGMQTVMSMRTRHLFLLPALEALRSAKYGDDTGGTTPAGLACSSCSESLPPQVSPQRHGSAHWHADPAIDAAQSTPRAAA